jgi:glycosyltransferase involved in cell wall biosynthesis
LDRYSGLAPVPVDPPSLRILLITGRFPEAGGRGDQIRGFQAAGYLSPRHRLTVIATEPPSTEAHRAALAELANAVHVVPLGVLVRALSALLAVATGRPAQTGWMMPMPTWRAARRLAADADVALVITSRSLQGKLPIPIVLDHIDALSHNMGERAKGPEPLPVRLFARIEAYLMAGWERRLAPRVAAQIGASQDVARLLPTPPEVQVLPIGWSGERADPQQGPRDIDVIFTGNMDYPPNRDGARWLQQEILPAVRARRPQTSGWIVGRAAAAVAGASVESASDVPDLHSYLRRARVAVAPTFGAGSPLKTLEAAACGAAVVSTSWGLDAYDLPGALANDTDAFVEAIVGLLEDDARRVAQVHELQAALERFGADRLGAQLDAIVRDAARCR